MQLRGVILAGGKGTRLGDAAGLVLHAVSEPAVVVAARAEQFHEVAHVLGAGHQQDVLHPGPGELLQRVVHHRPRTDRQQVLVGHPGQFAHAGSLPAGQYHTADGHFFSPLSRKRLRAFRTASRSG
jgi:hypothetical protein